MAVQRPVSSPPTPNVRALRLDDKPRSGTAPLQRRLCFAGRFVTLRCDPALAPLLAAFAPLPDIPRKDDARDAVLAFRSLETSSNLAAGLERLPTGICEAADGTAFLRRHDIRAIEWAQPGPPAALGLAATVSAASTGEMRASPGHFALAAWLCGPDKQMLHCAGIARKGRAALLLGVGGSGKSTTAVAAVASGWSYLGDDLCILANNTKQPTLHSLFASAKLTPQTDARLGLADWATLGNTAIGKRVVLLPESCSFLPSAPLAALIAVRPSADGQVRTAPLPRTAAVRALTLAAAQATTARARPAHWLQLAAATAAVVPAWQLEVGWDITAVIGALDRLIDD